jgi:FkbM family methyltransferase
MFVTRLRNALEKVGATGVLERVVALRDRTLSYSQFGEDVHIAALLGSIKDHLGIDVRPGWIIDVGSFRPIKYSNTYQFYKRGWRTINVDPTPGSKRLFDRVRPRDINLEIAIGPQAGRKDFYTFGQPSVWNTLDPAAAKKAAAILNMQPKVCVVDVARLEDVVQQHLGGQPLEMLFIDAEGYDIEILETHDWAGYPPRLILIEVHTVDARDIATHPVVSYLQRRNYRLHSWINPNFLFVRRENFGDDGSRNVD